MSSTTSAAAATHPAYTKTLVSLPAFSATTYAPQATTFVPVTTDYSHISLRIKVVLIVLAAFALVVVLSALAFLLWDKYRLQSKKPNKTFSKVTITKPDGQGSYAAINGPAHDEDRVKKPRSWRAPLLILGGLLFAAAFASGHYGFYNSIDQQPVQNVSISQSWVIRVGTLLAWCVKLSLSISIGVSFTQLQWVRLRRQPFKLRDIDSLSNILHNILNFFGSSIWIRYPMLTLVAKLCWLLPIIPVITPGTINVVSSQWLNQTNLQVPQLFIDSETWAISPGLGLLQAAPELQRLITATAMLGNILPMQFGYPNASYALNFTGPALKCQDADPKIVLAASLQLGGNILPEDNQSGSPLYFATVPSDTLSNTFNQSLVEGFAQCSYSVNDLDSESVDQAHIYIVTNDGTGASIADGNGTRSSVNVTDCALYEASYSVDFNFNNTEQTIRLQDISFLKGVSFTSWWKAAGSSQTPAYAALMSGFGSLLIGSVVMYGQQLGAADSALTYCTSIEYLNLGFEQHDFITKPLPYFVKNLQSGLEEMFHNITISLMSSQAFILPSSNASMVPVNLETTINVYSYSSDDLLLTYGLAIFVALLCSMLGLHAWKINGGSYQNNISTFIRAMKRSDLQIYDDDTGTDPIPKDLGETLVQFNQKRTSGYPTSTIIHRIPRKPVVSYQKIENGAVMP